MWCVAFAAGTLCACASTRPLSPTEAIAAAPSPLSLSAFDGATGALISWREVLDRVAAADAVFVGETHNDATAHAIEHELVASFLAAHHPAAVSMEFLERDDQAATEDYLAGAISMDEFIARTKSKDWAGADSWIPWYQPMIDSAKRSRAKVVAANAPRKYVSSARVDGYTALLALPGEERVLFEVDEEIARDGDWERLRELMIEMRHDSAKEDNAKPEPPSDDDVDAIHRSQRVWDRTMGTSAARAYSNCGAMIHIVGGFHAGNRLGTVAQFLKACTPRQVLIVALEPSKSQTLDPSDADGADVVIHTRALRTNASGDSRPTSIQPTK